MTAEGAMSKKELCDKFCGNVIRMIQNPVKSKDFYVLRRAFGKTMEDVDMKTLAAFYKLLPGEVHFNMDAWFVSATIMVYTGAVDGAEELPILVKKSISKQPTLETKYGMLLESNVDEVFYDTLCSIITRCKLKDTKALNARNLLRDVLNWDFDENYERTAQAWARKTYGE